jgi:hypothetical protein
MAKLANNVHPYVVSQANFCGGENIIYQGLSGVRTRLPRDVSRSDSDLSPFFTDSTAMAVGDLTSRICFSQ